MPDHPELPLLESEDRIGQLRYRLQPGPGYLRVEYAGEIDSIETAQTWIESIEFALRSHGLRKVLLDSRPAKPLTPDVREHIWAWLRRAEVLRASAILVESELLRVSANLSGMGGTLVIKAFGQPDQAIAWLSDIELS